MKKIIIFDDDPTGSQTVHDCLLLLRWDYHTLLNGLKSSSKLLFILCDTRSLTEKHVIRRLDQICDSLIKVIKNEGYSLEDFIFISRGDSTLRGHNFLEPYCLNKRLGPFDATFHIPAFIEGDRLTLNGRHFVNNIPAHKTIFAKDKIFGYETNNIKKILYKKSQSKLQLNEIMNLNLNDLNILSMHKEDKLFKKVKDFKNNVQIIVDVANYSHLKNFCLLVKQLKTEKKFLFRTAASFISAFSEIRKNPRDSAYYSSLRRKDNKNKFMRGLIVFGSHIELSTIQLQNLLDIPCCKPVEVNVNYFNILHKLRDPELKLKILRNQLISQIREVINNEFTPVLFTSRKVISFKANNEEFQFNKALSLFIAQIINELKYEIGYLISKGGITSNTILSDGFKVNYVYLEGQILNGISVVSVNLPNTKECIPLITFPGNIGSEDTMRVVWSILENNMNT